MSVSKPDRKDSRVEFDNTYFKVYHDAVEITNRFLFADEDKIKNRNDYIRTMSSRILIVASDIGTHIRIANSIYPTCKEEYLERRISQEKAIGLCYDLLTKYQLIMKELSIRDDKYVNEIKNVVHEINCLKKWRTSDNKRFGQLG